MGASARRLFRTLHRGAGAHRFPPGRTGRGAAWLARVFWVHEAAGSNPAAPTSG